MIYNKFNQDQEKRLIEVCKVIKEQKIHEMTFLGDDNLDYAIGAYKDCLEIRVKKQVQEGRAWIDYCDFYKVNYDNFELEYIRSAEDLA